MRRLGWCLLFFLACRSSAKDLPEPARAPEPASTATASAAPGEPERYELLSRLDSCDVDHEGLLLDLGTAQIHARRRFSVAPVGSGNAATDREGASFERVATPNLSFDVWLEQPIDKPMLSLRLHGGAARVLHFGVDELGLGAVRLPATETRVLTSATGTTPLARGRHRIVLRFSGAPRFSKVPLAEVDWIRLSESDPEPTRYAAPTREDMVADVALDRVPKHSLVLRAPSSIRCWLRPSRDARLKLSVGLLGAGKGLVEVRLLRDAEQPVLLQSRKVAGGDGATWTPVSVDLGEYATSVVGIELSALEATRGGRVAFGDPMIVRRSDAAVNPQRARVVVVVVLSAVDRARLPPWGPTAGLKTLGELARVSTAWSSHRVSSTVPAAVLASLLSGLPAAAHGVSDPSARLAEEIHTLPEIVKEASGRTAMFTGVPTSFAPFGFDQGWDLFEATSPVKDLPATEPMQRASRWLEQILDEGQGTPIFALVHARGAHPPWDVSREEAQQLKPVDYAGFVDPRRGGILIGALRNKQRRGKRLSEEDWARLRALGDAAVVKQDAAIGQLIGMLKRRGVWDETAFVVTGDVAPGEPPDFPFDPKGALTEDRLLTPLLVKLPNSNLGGKELSTPSSSEDLTVTLLGLLGLRVPRNLSGVDLQVTALGHDPLLARTQLATLGDRYATRLGSWLLRGQIGAVPTLCGLDVDPACASDAFDRELIAARALWHATFSALSEARSMAPPETSRRSLVLDPESASALVVWGDQ